MQPCRYPALLPTVFVVDTVLVVPMSEVAFAAE